MRLPLAELDDYVSRVAALIERYGVALDLAPDEPVELEESPTGAFSFSLRGFLPNGAMPPRSVLEVRERWVSSGPDLVERSEYEYELVDHDRDFRRAFHLHDREYFVRRFDVVVHEHCEMPIGTPACSHFEGLPVRDGYRAVELLLEIWVDPEVPDCQTMECLSVA